MTLPSQEDELKQALIRIAKRKGHYDKSFTNYLVTVEELLPELSALIAKAREIYIPVRGYEGLYEVSNLGNIRSLVGGRRRGVVLKSANRIHQYQVVTLCKDGAKKSESVHRLVALAFLSNPDNKCCVNHKDGNPANNKLENLEWATYAENEQYSFKHLGKINGFSKLKPENISIIRDRIANGEKLTSIAKDYGVHKETIGNIRRGTSWQPVGLKDGDE